MLQACAGSTPALIPATRPVLPAAPAAFGQPVPPPSIARGLDARALAARERAALLQANGRLRDDGTFYNSVLKAY
jgi:hypothetical protein